MFYITIILGSCHLHTKCRKIDKFKYKLDLVERDSNYRDGTLFYNMFHFFTVRLIPIDGRYSIYDIHVYIVFTDICE